MSWLSRFMLANWSHILGALILLIALVFGMQIGASRVQKAWDAEKLKIALTQARQEQRVGLRRWHPLRRENVDGHSSFLGRSSIRVRACCAPASARVSCR